MANDVKNTINAVVAGVKPGKDDYEHLIRLCIVGHRGFVATGVDSMIEIIKQNRKWRFYCTKYASAFQSTFRTAHG